MIAVACSLCHLSMKNSALVFPSKTIMHWFYFNSRNLVKMKAFRIKTISFQPMWRIAYFLCQLSVRKSWREVHPEKNIAFFFFFFPAMKVGEVNSCSKILTLSISNLLKMLIHAMFSLAFLFWTTNGKNTLKWNTVLRKTFPILAEIFFPLPTQIFI